MRLRRSLALALAASGALAPFASAAPAPAPQIVDPAGDQTGPGEYDLVSVLFESKMKDGKVDKLVATVTTGSAPGFGTLASYNIAGDVAGCGTLLLYSYNNAVEGTSHHWNFTGCGTGTNATGDPAQQIEPTVEFKGNTIVYTITGKSLPAEVKAGTVFSGLSAYTSPAEPVYAGYTPADFVPAASSDLATSDKTFKIG